MRAISAKIRDIIRRYAAYLGEFMRHHRFVFALFALLLSCAAVLVPARAGQEIPYIPSSDFKEKVVRANNPVVLQFGAEWCPYCRKVQADLQDLAADKRGQVDVYRINADEESDLMMIYRVRTLPTFVYFVNGREVDRYDGMPDREELYGWVEGQK
jgi:thioredoxin 1